MKVRTNKALLDKGSITPAGTIIDLDPETVKALGAAVEPIAAPKPEKGKQPEPSKPEPEPSASTGEPTSDIKE